MDFLPKTANLQGGDTRKTPNLANHGIHQEGKGPPHANPSQSTKSRQPLSILSNTNTLWSHIGCVRVQEPTLCTNHIQAMCAVVVSKTSCKDRNHPILRGVIAPHQDFFFFAKIMIFLDF